MPIVPTPRVVRVALVAIVLVGCSAEVSYDPTQSAPDASASASTTEPTPVPVLTQAQQGQFFLASDERFNGRLCRFYARWDGATDWQAMAPAIDKLAIVYRSSADALREIPWTVTVQKDMDDLIRTLAAQEAVMRAQAAAPDATTFWQIDRVVRRQEVKVAQMDNAVRGTLGIRSVGGDPCETGAADRVLTIDDR